MTILDNFLKQNCSEEQSSLLIFCFETLSQVGFVEIEFNIDELLDQIESLDLFELIQCCYQYIRKFQNMAFESLEIKIDNEDDIRTPNDLLIYLDQLEDSTQHNNICTIIDEASTPEDALLKLLTEVLFVDTSPLLPILHHVPGSLMERLYAVHKTDIDLTFIDKPRVKPIDERKLNLLKKIWSRKDINFLRNDILNNDLNLPISKSLWMQKQKTNLEQLKTSQDKKRIAEKLLEGCLVMNVEWKNIKKAMRALANEIYDDLLFITELSYVIDNICMENEINGAF